MTDGVAGIDPTPIITAVNDSEHLTNSNNDVHIDKTTLTNGIFTTTLQSEHDITEVTSTHRGEPGPTLSTRTFTESAAGQTTTVAGRVREELYPVEDERSEATRDDVDEFLRYETQDADVHPAG